MPAIQSYFFLKLKLLSHKGTDLIFKILCPDSLTDKGSGCRAAYEINNSNATEFLKLDTTAGITD